MPYCVQSGLVVVPLLAPMVSVRAGTTLHFVPHADLRSPSQSPVLD
jgi:hypothetical protein